MTNIQDGIKNVFEKKEEQKKKNLESLEQLAPFFSEFQLQIRDREFTVKIPPVSKEMEFINDCNNKEMKTEEFAKKWFGLLFGFDNEIIEEMTPIMIVMLKKEYISKYSGLLRDKSFLSQLGIEQ